nr:GGDEF domain-containing protein [Yoonia sp.]
MNRRAFDDVAQSMMRQHASKEGVTVFLMDIDGFKPINDSYSHEAGDAVLRAIATRLKLIAGRDGLVARLGGDEFAILRTSIASVQAAVQFGGKIAKVISQPVLF